MPSAHTETTTQTHLVLSVTEAQLVYGVLWNAHMSVPQCLTPLETVALGLVVRALGEEV